MWKFILIAVFSFVWVLRASDDYDEIYKSKTGCNSTLENNKSSSFDLNTHNTSQPCFWDINVTAPIRLFFFDLYLFEKDELNLYRNLEDAENRTNPLLEKPIQSQNGTITIITNETRIVVYLIRSGTTYERKLDGFYSVEECSVHVNPDVEILYSPVYLSNVDNEVECDYRFNEIAKKRVKQVFTFEIFNVSSSSVKVDGSTLPAEEYSHNPPMDFFADTNKKVLTIVVKMALNSTDHFRLKIHNVDSRCSEKMEFDGTFLSFHSPENEFNNGTIEAYECRWLVIHKKGNILGLKFDKLHLSSVFDIIAINDGLSEISPSLFQITASDKNSTHDDVIRTNGSSLWVAFKPLNYESSFTLNITVHEQGGYFKNVGEINIHSTDGDDTAFLLEVDDKEIVMLNIDSSSVIPPATVSVYDGFNTRNLLTSFHGQVDFPVLSRSSRMMVTGTKFSNKANHFSAKFKGISPGCNQMSSLSAESYILNENCNASCVWVIPPQNSTSTALVVYLQYLSLKEGDNLKVHKLDADLTQLVNIGANQTHIPHISVPADVGVLLNITQATCEKKSDKIVFIGHSAYIPACDFNIAAKPFEVMQISSPLYPDTYPVFSRCHWNISSPKKSIVHMAFQNMNLAENHCINIQEKSSKPLQYEGKTLPDDIFVSGDILINFDAVGCNKTRVGKNLNSDSGFLLNITITDCGAIYDGKKTGEFTSSISGSTSVCIWKVSVPPTEGSSVNIVSYAVSKKDQLKNYELHVYDGSSVRDSEITNNTDSEIWSRTNTLIFVYKRMDSSQPSGVLSIKYNTVSCNSSMQCDNKICMHPSWRCDGVNNCGDYSDERNCASVPVPPNVTQTGYSATAFWLCMLAMLVIGAILGVIVPVIYQKYKDSRYRRFHELDS